MQTVQGVIEKKSGRQWQDKTFYSFALQGQQGWYRLGTNPMAGVAENGAMVQVTFTTDAKGNNNVKQGGIQVLGAAAPQAVPQPTAVPAAASPAPSNVGTGTNLMSKKDWADKDQSIQYQSARNAAIDYMRLLVQSESLDLPGKNKKVERKQAMDTMLDILTAKFFVDIEGRSAVSRAEAEYAQPDQVAEVVTQPPVEAYEQDSPWGGDEFNE